MLRSTVLLRVLLCLILILNGTGSAVASVRMALPSPEHATANQPASISLAGLDQHAPPCHEAAVKKDSDARSAAHPVDIANDHAGDAPNSDCCGAGHCACACAQLVLAELALAALPAISLNTVLASRPLPPGHAAPMLGHLIRPPIG